MTISGPEASRGGLPRRNVALAGLLLTAAIAVCALLWAKWVPYSGKVGDLFDSRTWAGSDILRVGGVEPGDAPSIDAALSFSAAYGLAIWKALAAALLISAALQSLVRTDWLVRVMRRRGHFRTAVAGALVSTPSMMCTCCTAPVAVSLRKRGVPAGAAVAYWLGNPLLNPAVLVFFLLVAPWEWTLTRFVFGAALVLGAAVLVGRLSGGGETVTEDDQPTTPAVDENWLAGAPARFGRALLRLCLVLVPEYAIVVLLVGAFRGWLFPVGTSTLSTGILVALVATVVGTLVVIPTGGEIAIVQGLALTGVGAGALGALLVTLPAVSLPGIAMVGRAFGWRATVTTTVTAMVTGALAGMFITLIA